MPEKLLFCWHFYVPAKRTPPFTSFSIQKTLQPIKLLSHAGSLEVKMEIMITHQMMGYGVGFWGGARREYFMTFRFPGKETCNSLKVAREFFGLR